MHEHTATSTSWWSQLWDGLWMPHGHCYLWNPWLVWLNVLSDALIAAAYYSIPFILFRFVAKRRKVPFNGMFLLFGIFIFACGTTHLLEVLTVWHPWYVTGGIIKAITAVASLMAAISLFPMAPRALDAFSLDVAYRHLERTNEDLRRLNKELEQVAYVASHDLREPLRTVSVYLSLLETKAKGRLGEEELRYIQLAREGATRMQHLVRDVLSFTLSGYVEGAAACEANEACDQAIADLRETIDAAGATVTRGELPRLPVALPQLAQVFQNLLSNAVKYRGAAPPVVRVEARREGREWIVTVADNGMGIDPRYHERVFQLFQRLHGREVPGTGIGLSVVKKIVEQCGGRIWIESRAGEGARFHMAWPADA